MLFLRCIMALVVCLAFLACSDTDESSSQVTNGSDGEMMAPDAGVQTCSLDTDCTNGRVCEQGTCELGCGSMIACPDGYECEDGRLCRAVQACTSDADCGSGVCDCLGICRQAPVEPCSTDLQCDVQDFCDTCRGSCASRAAQCEPCESDSQCAANAKCRLPDGGAVAAIAGIQGAGVCLRQCQGSCDILGPGYQCQSSAGELQVCVPESGSCGSLLECDIDSDCAPREFCNDRKICQPGCTDDTECPMGTLCQGVRCLAPCDDTNPCAAGLICDNGRCGVENGCASSADCPMPETFCDRSTYLCASGCEVDDDCQDATKQCVSGSCRERGCSGNYQCAFGQVCALDSGQCVAPMGRHCEAGCDPQTEGSCGETAICVSLQDADENPLGDFCFESCLEVPNECPQGYQCVEFEDQSMGMGMSGGPTGSYCLRDCSYNPTSN